MILYKKEWDDIMILEVDGDLYQLNDKDDLVYTLVDILSPGTKVSIETLGAEDFWEKLK